MIDRPPRRGWTAYVEQNPAEVMGDMPPDLASRVHRFIVALALEAGGAIDAGKEPPGDPVGEPGIHYSLQVQGEPVIVEYTVDRSIREIRIPALVWFH